MSAHHVAGDCDYLHDRDHDTSEARVPTAQQREAIDLLDIGGTGRLVRLSLHDWRRVDRLTAALARRGAA